MKINAGKFKGFPILTRPVAGTRPTSDKVKQAIFNILGSVQGKAVLDLFSGFGALGLEALSRGASRVVLVESNPRCARIIEENLAKFPEKMNTNLLAQDVFKAIVTLEKKAEIFDVILSDAPYAQAGMNAKLLKVLANSSILSTESLLIVQHDKGDVLAESVESMRALRCYHYGLTSITIYKKTS